MIDRTLKHYRITALLGAGGMGAVYLAQDTKLDRKVALKVLPAGVATNPDRMERFIREAKAAAALNHPNLRSDPRFEELMRMVKARWQALGEHLARSLTQNRHEENGRSQGIT